MTITFDTLEIPPSLHRWYLERGWFPDYWKEIPYFWKNMTDEELRRHPITNEIVLWRKEQTWTRKNITP